MLLYNWANVEALYLRFRLIQFVTHIYSMHGYTLIHTNTHISQNYRFTVFHIGPFQTVGIMLTHQVNQMLSIFPASQ